ncbi:class I SAM-dependent methyltransferase [Bacillus xiapuensis]|uniref:class I SAM-dependent methyltransferase n=1 Tax=Bacillus xiapuensis TaxID=2014075 RepID=UPI001E2EEEDF|nr:class I SAM-dependent methyltransferase [Bacillus xiapuensis]
MTKEHWNQRFGEEEYAYGKEPNAFIQEMAPQLPAGNMLAIAEGEGRNAVFLASLGHQVTVWDYATEGLKKTKQLAGEKGVQVKTVCLDLNEAPWKEQSWDHIICVFGHFETDLRLHTLKAIEKAVKAGGSFLCEVYSADQLHYQTGGPRDIQMLYRPEELLNTFADWHILHFFMGEVERQEGRLHQGVSHVIQFYGTKRG